MSEGNMGQWPLDDEGRPIPSRTRLDDLLDHPLRGGSVLHAVLRDTMRRLNTLEGLPLGPRLTPLQYDALEWCVEKAAQWKGSIHPNDYQEFDNWIKQAEDALKAIEVTP